MTDRLEWLHGWPRFGNNSVLLGAGIHCAGCGRSQGVTSVVIDPDYAYPDRQPDWPFPEESCPVCLMPDPVPVVAPLRRGRLP
jgi:hypothetical protein